jgi:hypothetical protein
METTLSSVRTKLRESYQIVADIKLKKQRHLAQQRIRVAFFTKLRAKLHIDEGYPINDFRLSLIPERNEHVKDWLLSYQAYTAGVTTRTNLGSKEENPYRPGKGKYSKRTLALEHSWDWGFNGNDFFWHNTQISWLF